MMSHRDAVVESAVSGDMFFAGSAMCPAVDSRPVPKFEYFKVSTDKFVVSTTDAPTLACTTSKKCDVNE